MAARGDTEQLVLGRYRLRDVIGRGGAGRVHRALDVRTGQDVAVKEIPAGAEMARRAGAEVRAAARLSHPGIVRLLDFGEDRSSCYLVSELVPGSSLAAEMQGGGMATRPAVLIGVVADVLDGLAHAHARGVTHRDVKPANILVDRSGRGRLADFGIARIAGEAGLTTTGGLVGTVSYMAPEQARGEDAGSAADVYAASLVAYEGLTGRNPLLSGSPGETLRRAAAGDLPKLRDARKDLPAALCRAIDAGLDPDPRKRPDPAWLAGTLRAQLRSLGGGAAAAPRRFARALPAVATAGAAAGIGAVVLHRTTSLEPGAVAVASAGAGIAFAAMPWHVALLAWVGAMAGLGVAAPGLAMIVGALGLVALAPLRTRGRLALVPAAAPVLAGLGVAPLIAAFAGSIRGWRWRIWTALTAAGSALCWELVAGADPGLHGGPVTGTWERVRGVVSPVEVTRRLGEPIRERPVIAIAAGIIALGALAVPLVLRLRAGLPRAAGALAWLAALLAGVRIAGGSVEQAGEAYLAAGILVVAWSAGPWRRLRRDADRRTAVTLPGSTVERLPAA